jgi:lipopolysaccharide heptosyltransferase I
MDAARTSPPDAAEMPQRILVVRLGALGDIVRTLPAVRLLRRSFPNAELAWAIEPGPSRLVAGHPDVDRLLVLERRRIVRGARSLDPRSIELLRSFTRALREFSPDLSLDFQGSLKSALVSRLSRATRRVGFDAAFVRERAHLFATERIELANPRMHRVERAVTLAVAAGAAPGPIVADLALDDDERRAGLARVRAWARGRDAVALAPFSSTRQAWKRYPVTAWAETARRLAQAGFAVLVLGGPNEEEETTRLCAAAGEGVVPGGEGGPRELAATLAACRLFVGGDTGPMHMAWAVGLSCVVVFGPTDPALNAPWGEGHVVLAPESVSQRRGADVFPGITPELIAARCLERLGQPAATSKESTS